VPKNWPVLRQACREMLYDSCGISTDADVDAMVDAAEHHCTREKMQRAEDFLLYLDERGGIDSAWSDATCGNSCGGAPSWLPRPVARVLDFMFDGE
jgi:hypothetical protein